jgi:hypothetical protein
MTMGSIRTSMDSSVISTVVVHRLLKPVLYRPGWFKHRTKLSFITNNEVQ